MDAQIKDRNRQHLIKGLALGLPMEGSRGHYRIGSESATGVDHHVDCVEGRWYCGCRWAADTFPAGYDPRSNAKPCKHMLLAIAADLPVKRQDELVRSDPALRAAVTSGYQLRARRCAPPAALDPLPAFNAAIVAEGQLYATRARYAASTEPAADGTLDAMLAARRQAVITRGAQAATELYG